jgi:hypothetical protein
MTKRISERQRWVHLIYVGIPSEGLNTNGIRQKMLEASAIVEAFEKVGRVVRIERAKSSSGFVLKARKS